MKKTIAFAFILAMAGCQYNPSSEPGSFKTIMIRSSGEVETLPDMATFQINLSCLDKSVKASKGCLVERSNELNSKLLSFGILQKDILTTSVDMDKSYTWQRNSRVFEGYRSSCRMLITIKNLDTLDDIYTELLENRNLELGSLSYSHSMLDSLKNEAYLDALRKSAKLADKLLTELPETKKELLKIGNVEISSSNPTDKRIKVERDRNADYYSANEVIAISTGTVRVDATLFAEYEIR